MAIGVRSSVIDRVLQRRADNSSEAVRELWQLSQLVPRDSWHRAQVTLYSSTPFRVISLFRN